LHNDYFYQEPMLANRLTKNIIKNCNKDCLHTEGLRSFALGDWLLPESLVECHTPYNHPQLFHNHWMDTDLTYITTTFTNSYIFVLCSGTQ